MLFETFNLENSENPLDYAYRGRTRKRNHRRQRHTAYGASQTLPKRQDMFLSELARVTNSRLHQLCPEIGGYIITEKGLDYLDYSRKKFWTVFSFVVSTAVASMISICIGYLFGLWLK